MTTDNIFKNYLIEAIENYMYNPFRINILHELRLPILGFFNLVEIIRKDISTC